MRACVRACVQADGVCGAVQAKHGALSYLQIPLDGLIVDKQHIVLVPFRHGCAADPRQADVHRTRDCSEPDMFHSEHIIVEYSRTGRSGYERHVR